MSRKLPKGLRRSARHRGTEAMGMVTVSARASPCVRAGARQTDGEGRQGRSGQSQWLSTAAA